ncbi:hypothetical protein GIB67_010520 [Kingdonia uniflora]|uniref:Uncharacterized protein n=1 Tax=Kingdonia uniflora TaxID=39325 RepID=A0A7J7MAM6_9MAGN|nr:hypothetical protein GIB67_010520 [Kingdonia uniflora]
MAAKAAGMKVVVVLSIQTQADRYSVVDFVLHSLLEFQPEPWGLPAFEDYDGPSSLADQVSGVYFGWAKLNMDEIIKVVVGIGWKWDSCITRRLIAKKLINIELVEEDKLIACKALDLPIFVQSYEELSVLKLIDPGK